MLAVILGALLLVVPDVHAQNVASQKAAFGNNTTEILSPFVNRPALSGQIKTSGVGDVLIGFSMECALWTATSNTVTKGGTKSTSTSSSRAAVNVTVKVDGDIAEPGQVVYCDRLQQVDLTFSSLTEVVTDQITLDIFLQTKNANHFNFYYLNPGSDVHTVEVFVDSVVEGTDSPIVLANTRAVVGRRTLTIEEYNNP